MTPAPRNLLLRTAALILAAAVLVTGCLPAGRGKKLGPLPDLAFEAPDLTGLTPDQAAKACIAATLTLGQITYTADSRWAGVVEPGLIAAQSRAPGVRLPKGAVIDVTVYKPIIPEHGEVPDVVGLQYADAVKLLADSGFLPGDISWRHARDARLYNQVYRQSPEPGAKALRWTKINLGLYGPVEEGFVRVPRLTGLKATEVPTVLGKLGLLQGKITFEKAPSASFIGTVRAQSPAIGTRVKQGTKVDITVYSE